MGANTDVPPLMEAINAIRSKLWTGPGTERLGLITYLDTDGTLIPTYGEHKAEMNISYTGIRGDAPLTLSIANTKGVWIVVTRPGNAPAGL